MLQKMTLETRCIFAWTLGELNALISRCTKLEERCIEVQRQMAERRLQMERLQGKKK